jgi:hypothetical protein
MLQRGRKSKGSREVLALVGKGASHLQVAPPDDPPPPPEHLGIREQEAWKAIVREHSFNRAGHVLLENGLQSLRQARVLRTIIDRDGVMLINRDGLPRKHPALALEVQLRKLAWDIFKAMKIELRNET